MSNGPAKSSPVKDQELTAGLSNLGNANAAHVHAEEELWDAAWWTASLLEY